MDKVIVITTINPKTTAIEAFEKRGGWHLILVGDQKSVDIPTTKDTRFVSLSEQNRSEFEYPRNCPKNHYCRKNAGYLYAIEQGAEVIFDTDDDNAPLRCWDVPEFLCNRSIAAPGQFVNVYRYFSDLPIWPRGYPLEEIRGASICLGDHSEPVEVGIWQGLANGDPDVDAIYRLIDGRLVNFLEKPSVFLPEKFYCPFNSQNTFWRKELFPLMYLPCTVSFRFTDILRSYVAQRLCWHQGFRLGFTGATVHQDRNAHDLMKDFEQEVQSYTKTKIFVELLNSMKLSNDVSKNLYDTYSAFVSNGLISQTELHHLEAWILDLKSLGVLG